jgi:hypothetical protein
MSHVLDHWPLMLCAAAAGVALGVVVLSAIYLAPLLLSRLTGSQERRERVLEEERRRLRRLRDALAVHQEHGHPDANELRDDIELHSRSERWSGGCATPMRAAEAAARAAPRRGCRHPQARLADRLSRPYALVQL